MSSTDRSARSRELPDADGTWRGLRMERFADSPGGTISLVYLTFTFTVSIFVLGIACFFGGLWLNRKGSSDEELQGIIGT